MQTKLPMLLSGYFQLRMEQHFPGCPKTWTTSRAIPKFSKISHLEFPFHLILVIMSGLVQKLTNFRIFQKLFQELSVSFATFSNVPEFLLEWEAPLVRLSSFSEIPESDVSFVTEIIRKITLEFVLKKNWYVRMLQWWSTTYSKSFFHEYRGNRYL